MKNEKDKEAALDVDVEVIKPTPLFCSTRLALAICAFFMFFHLYAQRVGMSVAIVSMVNQTAIRELEALSESTATSPVNETSSIEFNPQCSRDTGVNGTKTSKDGPFIWPKEIQGHILGAFFYGYLVSQVPGGLLAERFGAKWIIAGFLGLSTFATFLTPLASRISFGVLIALRVLCGIGSGALFPAMHAMLGQWAPPTERSKLCGLVMAGTTMGNVITMPVAGVLCEHGFSDGWDSVFYVIGITSVITIAFWLFITSDTPASHKHISKSEQDYIMRSLQTEVNVRNPTLCEMPWGKILTSGPVWALILANFCVDWGLYTYLTNIPTFFNEVLYFDIQSNGFYSALPFLGLWASCNVCPIIADKLLSANILRIAYVRKLFNTAGMVGAAILLIGLSFIDCTNTILAVTLLVIAVSMTGMVYSGYYVNHMDIAPRYAGTLMGIANGIAAASGFIAPYIAAVLTKDQKRESWQIVFFIAAGVYVFGAIMYCVLGSGTLQPWARSSGAAPVELEVVAKDGAVGPIYKPKSAAANGDMSMEPMLDNRH